MVVVGIETKASRGGRAEHPRPSSPDEAGGGDEADRTEHVVPYWTRRRALCRGVTPGPTGLERWGTDRQRGGASEASGIRYDTSGARGARRHATRAPQPINCLRHRASTERPITIQMGR